MAKLYGEIAAKALLTLDKSFARANGQPLDASEVYYSLQAAKDYAATAQAYIGQKIVVIENGIVTHYSVEDTSGTLKELGSKPVADGTTVAIGTDGKITLANISESNKTGTYNAVLVNGVLTWVKPSETTVEGLSDLIQALTGRVDVVENDIDALQEAVGVASKPESSEGANDAVAATGLFKAIEDEAARALAAEKALGERIDAIDFIDSDELNTALEPYAKTADLPVIGVAADDKVLSLNSDKLIAATIAMSYDSENKKIVLRGKDNVDLGSVDATPFIKDGMLESVNYNPDTKTITFKWNTASGITEDTVELGDLIDTYAAGNGLVLTDNIFAIQLAEGNENFLSVDANGLKLTGVQNAINTAKQDAIDAAASAAASIYATQTALSNLETSLDERLDILEAYDHSTYATKTEINEYKTTVENTYATKDALAPVKQTADNAAAKVETLEDKIEEITSVGGEPNVIDYIKVNGTILEVEKDSEGKSTKTVNITVPTKVSDLTDDTGFDARITAAQNQADKGVSDAAAAASAASQAQSEVDALETEVGNLQNTVAGHTTSISDHSTRIGALEQADITHATEYNTLSGIVTGHTETIAKKADQTSLDAVVSKTSANETAIKTLNETTIPAINSEIAKKADASILDNYYTKSEVGTIEEGKTLIKMIEEAASAAEYDDTEVRGLITAETNRATGVEADFEQRIAEMETFWDAADDPEGTIDKLAEIVNYINADKTGALDMAADIKANTDAISAINNETTGILAVAKEYTNNAIGSIPAATAEVLGLVKYDNSTIKMNESKQLYVAKISTDILEQGELELILNGGSAV